MVQWLTIHVIFMSGALPNNKKFNFKTNNKIKIK